MFESISLENILKDKDVGSVLNLSSSSILDVVNALLFSLFNKSLSFLLLFIWFIWFWFLLFLFFLNLKNVPSVFFFLNDLLNISNVFALIFGFPISGSTIP